MSGRDVLLVAVVVLALLLLFPVLGMVLGGWGWMMGPGMMGPGMMGRWGWGAGWGWGGVVGAVAVLLLVAGVVLVVLGLTRREGPDSALEILRQRLARGEISPEQYEELRKLLQ